jgi:hypothetical protein
MRRTAKAVVLLLCSCGSEPAEMDADAAEDPRPVLARYAVPVADAWNAAEDVVWEEDVSVERRRRGERRAELVVRRADGHRVRVVVRAQEGGGSEVSVGVRPASRSIAGLVQERIAGRLSLQKAQADLFGERAVETSWPADLRRCMEAAERACGALDLTIVHRQLEDAKGRIVARDASGRTFRIALQPSGTRETGAVFTAEEESEDLLKTFGREFGRQLFPAAD